MRMTEEEYQKRLSEAKARNIVRVRAEKAQNGARGAAIANLARDTTPTNLGVPAVQFTVPGVPFPWQRARSNGKVRFNSRDMMSHQRTVQSLAQLAGAVIIKGPVRLEVDCWMPIPPSWSGKRQERARMGLEWPIGTPDADNLLKQVSDALQGTAYVTDAVICEAMVTKWYVRHGQEPRTEVRITPLL